jgi:hypothetical protein
MAGEPSDAKSGSVAVVPAASGSIVVASWMGASAGACRATFVQLASRVPRPLPHVTLEVAPAFAS